MQVSRQQAAGGGGGADNKILDEEDKNLPREVAKTRQKKTFIIL